MMVLMRRIGALLMMVLAVCSAWGQELNCKVEINSDQVQTTNKQLFQTLQEAVSDYMNTTQWTNAQFANNEKIECRLFITIKEATDDGKYKGDIQVQATRPVFNSTYTTTLINFKDSKIDFTYSEGEPLRFTLNDMESQLTAILNFYAYLILAVDFDSFSPRGGDPYYDRLKQIVQMAQNSGEVGWKAFEDTKNRSAVLSALTDPGTVAMRDLIYKYHRQGLDQMALSPDKGRANITEALGTLPKIYQSAPMSVNLSMWRDAKMDELVNVYSKAQPTERETIYKILADIYPTENERLRKIKDGDQKR